MKSVLIALLLLSVGAAATLLFRSPTVEEPVKTTRAAATARQQVRATVRLNERSSDDRQQEKLERQVSSLIAKVAEESAKRQRLEEQVQELTSQLAALAHGNNDTAHADATPGNGATPNQDVAAANPPNPANTESGGGIERALIAAGVDATTAGDIKRRRDQLVMDEIYLRNQATREAWVDTPQFRDELAAIEAQRTSIRDDIGDEAYDRYLFAQGHTNRVRVDDVLSDSVAADAGLQAGDIVLRYGDTRIFGPEELVNETRSGRAGESIQLEVIRNGASVVVQVPRGPLGLRVAGTQSEPPS